MARAFILSALCSVLMLVAGPGSCFAQEAPKSSDPTAAIAQAAVEVPQNADFGARRDFRRGPSFLMQSLYAATVVVQGLDTHSTFRALDAGGQEGNPFIGKLAEHRPAFLLFKAGIAASAIYLGRDMSKGHKVRAAITLIAINSAYLALVANNYRVAASMQRRR
jgi:hypothetical protein